MFLATFRIGKENWREAEKILKIRNSNSNFVWENLVTMVLFFHIVNGQIRITYRKVFINGGICPPNEEKRCNG